MPSNEKRNNKVKASKLNQPDMLAFQCPICGSDTLAEVWYGGFESIFIGGLVPGKGALVKGAAHDNGPAEFKGYYCANCSLTLVNLDGKQIKS